MYNDPATTILIHRRIVEDALERHGPDHLLRNREPFPRAGLLPVARHAAARAMHWLADRVDTAHGVSGAPTLSRPTDSPPAPLGETC